MNEIKSEAICIYCEVKLPPNTGTTFRVVDICDNCWPDSTERKTILCRDSKETK